MPRFAMDPPEAGRRLREIATEIKALLMEASEVAGQHLDEVEREGVYRGWYADIERALDDDHHWVGRHYSTIRGTSCAIDGTDPEDYT